MVSNNFIQYNWFIYGGSYQLMECEFMAEKKKVEKKAEKKPQAKGKKPAAKKK